MKYFIECSCCGGAYETDGERVPSICTRCGADAPKVTMFPTKARLRAVAAMHKMDGLKPQLLAARKAYMDLLAEYEVECQIVRAYSRRGIVTPEEKERYMIKSCESLHRATLTEHLKNRWGKENG